MAIRTFNLADEFIDAAAEQSLLASLVQHQDLYWDVVDWLPAGAFMQESAVWDAIGAGVETSTNVVVPNTWTPAPDPQATARRLSDLYQRRLLAGAQQRLATALYSEEHSAVQVARMLEDEAAAIQNAVQEAQSGQLHYAKELLSSVLAFAAEQYQRRVENQDPIRGLRTGFGKLDEVLGGLGTGLYLLAGAPGVGKTTLALQIAATVAERGTPVIYVTYENSAQNLILKLLGARAKVGSQPIERGMADLRRLREVSRELEPALERLIIIEGTSRLSMAEVKAKALRARHRAQSGRCLVVIDYLQRAAHTQGYDQIRHNVSQLAGTLRDMSNRLESPVLALCSQNRAGGQYGVGGGTANLDSLKESGDLEYSADAVLFLCPSERRQSVAPSRAIDLALAKNRYGDLGIIPLQFRPDIGEMREEGR